MFAFRDLVKYLRVLRLRAYQDPVIDDYRGWSWYKEPVKPPAYKSVSISDFAYLYCNSLRNVYLKYVLKIEGKLTRPIIEGWIFHNILYNVLEDVKKLVYSGYRGKEIIDELLSGASIRKIEDNVEYLLSLRNVNFNEIYVKDIISKALSLYEYVVLYYSGEVEKIVTELVDTRADAIIGQVIPQISQFHIDGYLIGLSRKLIIDAIMPNVIIEFKFSNGFNTNIDNYSTALAGYALAIESDLEIPIDYALIVKIWFDKIGRNDKFIPRISITPIYLGNEVRREFLNLRDEVYDIIYTGKDPGIARNCSETCPYVHVCKGVNL